MHRHQAERPLGVLMAVLRNALLLLLAALLFVGCGTGGGDVIQPENKGAAAGPGAAAPKPPSG